MLFYTHMSLDYKSSTFDGYKDEIYNLQVRFFLEMTHTKLITFW